MRLTSVVLAFLLPACAGQVAVKNVRGQVHFDFAAGAFGRGLNVRAIAVYEIEEGRRGREVCSLETRMRQVGDDEGLVGWTYGVDIGGKYHLSRCESLAGGRPYGIAVYLTDRRMVGASFQVRPDGSAFDLTATKRPQ